VDVNDLAGFRAKVIMVAVVSKWVDTCMDRNYCLKKLGDGSAAAFELRNNNRRQYECLQGTPAAHLKTECDIWRVCFAGQGDGTHEADLLKVLHVIFRPAAKKNKKKRKKRARVSSLGQKEATPMKELLGASSFSNIKDAPGCTDPAVADVEALECECLDEVRNNCAAKGVTDMEECFLTYMCDNVAVCASWQEGHCPGGGSSLMQRSSVALKSAASATVDQEKKMLVNRSARSASAQARDELDGALSGKCSSETQ